MSKTIIVKTPHQDCEILDFGAGRVLQRYGPMRVDRPSLDRSGERELDERAPDWKFTPVAATTEWRSVSEQSSQEWWQKFYSAELTLRLFDNGMLSLNPEHFACAQWVDERLRGCCHMKEIRVGYSYAFSVVASEKKRITP